MGSELGAESGSIMILSNRKRRKISPLEFPERDKGIKFAKHLACFLDSSVGLLQCRRPWFDSWVGKIPWIRDRLPTPIFWPGEFHGQRSLAGYNPWGCKESETTERISLYFLLFSSVQSLSCVQLFVTQWTAAHRPHNHLPEFNQAHCPLIQ